MSLPELMRSAGVLPITEGGLAGIVRTLSDLRGEAPDGEDYLVLARYPIRAVAALLPVDQTHPVLIARAVHLPPGVDLQLFLDVLDGLGDFRGETGAGVLRRLLGLVDDGLSPRVAADHLGIDGAEAAMLIDLLDLDRHWLERMSDRVQVAVVDGHGPRRIARDLGLSRRTTRALVRMVRETPLR